MKWAPRSTTILAGTSFLLVSLADPVCLSKAMTAIQWTEATLAATSATEQGLDRGRSALHCGFNGPATFLPNFATFCLILGRFGTGSHDQVLISVA